MTLSETFVAALPFLWFIAISSVTPGPNNLMLAASGMNYGIRRSIPHMVGVAAGFGLLMLICAFGLGAVFHAVPFLRVILNIFAAGYLLYLGWAIATSGNIEVDGEDETHKPMTFQAAFLFQFVNPKALVMALAATGTLLPQNVSILAQSLIILVVVFAINMPCIGIWTVFGRGMAKIFKTDRTRRIVNIALGGALVLTIPMMLL